MGLRRYVNRASIGIIAGTAIAIQACVYTASAKFDVTPKAVVQYFSRSHHKTSISEELRHPKTVEQLSSLFDFSKSMNPGGLVYRQDDGSLRFYPIVPEKAFIIAAENESLQRALEDALSHSDPQIAYREAERVLKSPTVKERMEQNSLNANHQNGLIMQKLEKAMQQPALEQRLKDLDVLTWVFSSNALTEYDASLSDHLLFYGRQQPSGRFVGEYHCHGPTQIATEEAREGRHLVLYRSGQAFLIEELDRGEHLKHIIPPPLSARR
jgi:hypothetical protein